MGLIGKRKGVVAKGAGHPAAPGSDAIGGSLSKNDHYYLQEAFGLSGNPGLPYSLIGTPSGMTASGGVVGEYSTPPGSVYRFHVFTGSNQWIVSALAPPTGSPNDVDYVLVGGGGGGGLGGGGAGGMLSSIPGEPGGGPTGAVSSPFTATAITYSIGVGGGGFGQESDNVNGTNGGSSSISTPTASLASAFGGGGGAGQNPGASDPANGSTGGTGRNPTAPATAGTAGAAQGYPGGPGRSGAYTGGGGGGAGGTGPTPTDNAHGGIGGIGKRTTIAGPSYAIGSNGPGPTLGGWLAGGGGGQSYPGSTDGGGGGGGAPRTSPPTGKDRLVNNWAGGGSGMDGTSSGPLPTSTLRNMRGLTGTGGGGGGSYGNIAAGNGGSGVVALRYQIGTITATAKATGGSVTYFAPQTKVIHSFTTSGTFTLPAANGPVSVEYVICGGGGSGGAMAPHPQQGGGGGGAGGYRTGTTTLEPGTYSWLVGAGGAASREWASPGGLTSLVASPTVTLTVLGGGHGNSVEVSLPNTQGAPSVDTPTAGGGSGGGGFGGPLGGEGGTYGNDGGGSPSSSPYGSGGGGGAGGVGGSTSAAPGGAGVELPATFQSPDLGIGENGPGTPSGYSGTNFWVAGGGGAGEGSGGGTHPGNKGGTGGAGPAPGEANWSGGGRGSTMNNPGGSPVGERQGKTNSGGGGGGGTYNPESIANQGGSGFILIAYNY